MELSITKLSQYLAKDGKYAKHANLYRLSKAEDMDYITELHYALPVPKGSINYAENIGTWNNGEEWIEEAETYATKELEFVETREYVKGKYVCVFKPVGEDEEIWINRKFFTEFINKAFSPTGGFVDGITFTGSDMKSPVFMWNGDDFAGLFLPIRH